MKMNLIERLRIIKRAAPDNSVLPALKTIHVYDGRMQSSDGRIVIDCECPELKDMTFSVNGNKFVKAIEATDGTPDSIEVKDDALHIKKGKFKVRLPLLGIAYPKTPLASRPSVTTHGQLISALRAVQPFVGTDASRPWACGALFKNKTVLATNNTVIVRKEYAIGDELAVFNIPLFTIDELIAIGTEPNGVIAEENAVTFTYDKFWIRTQLFDADWPDLSKVLPAINISSLENIPEGLNTAVDKVLNFCPDTEFQCIVFTEDSVATTEGEISARFEGFRLSPGRFRAGVLQLVLKHAHKADFSQYPAAVPFATKEELVGVFVGVRA